MIHYLLYSVPKDKAIHKNTIIYFIFFIVSLVLIIFSLLLFFYKIDNKICSIASIIMFGIGLIILIANLVKLESFQRRTVRSNYHEFNNELDDFRTILENAEFDNPSNTSSSPKQNWYTKEKLKFLIGEFDKLSTDKTKKDTSTDPLKYYIFSVISFAGGAIANKAKLGTIITVALVAITGILVCWCIIQTIKDLGDAISYSSSDNHIRKVHDLLNNLYIRDFDDSAPVNTNAPAQSNTP